MKLSISKECIFCGRGEEFRTMIVDDWENEIQYKVVWCPDCQSHAYSPTEYILMFIRRFMLQRARDMKQPRRRKKRV
jgi:hypothetical protein